MAGYMSKLSGYIFEGEFANGTGDGIENGALVVLGTGSDAGKMVLPSADTTTKLLCKEVATIYDGVPAYRFVVNALAANYYFVENGFTNFIDATAYDLREYVTPDGELLRAHPLLVGEEFVTTKVTGTPVVGTEYGVKADGTVG